MELDHHPGAVDSAQARAGAVLPVLTRACSTASAPSREQEQQGQASQQDSHVQPLSAAEQITASQPVSLCSLPDPLTQHVLHMLDNHSRDHAMASCKQVGRLMLTAFNKVCYKLDGSHSKQIGTALGKRIQWALESCKNLHLAMDTPLCIPLTSLTSAMPGGCLPSVTKLTLKYPKLDGLLPAYMVEALPNLKSVDYDYCRFDRELLPVCTSPAVKVEHLGLYLHTDWNASEWSAAQKQQLQDICQLRSITSLGIPLHGPTAACLSQMTSQLTAVTFYVDNDWQDASAWHVIASCASLQQFAAKFSAGWRYKIGVPVQQAVQTPGLSTVEISGVPISSQEMVQLSSLPHLTSLAIHSVSEDLPSTWMCNKLQHLFMQRATLQHLASAPLQQLTEPLKLQVLVISQHALQEQLLWAAAAAERLRAGPGYCVSWDKSSPQYSPRVYHPRFEVDCMADAPALVGIAQILEACRGLLPSEHHTPAYTLTNMDLNVPVIQALKRCLSLQTDGIGGLLRLIFFNCSLQPGAGAALAAAFPDLEHPFFNTLPEMEELKGYLCIQQQQRQSLQSAPKQDLYLRMDGNYTHKCYKQYVDQLEGHLRDNSIDWFTLAEAVGIFPVCSDDTASEGASDEEDDKDEDDKDSGLQQ